MFGLKNLEANILRLLNIESNEASIVKLLLLQSFFIGVFYAVFDITAQSVFLDSFDSSMTSVAILISGGVGLAITSFYSRMLRKIKLSRLLLFNFAFILISLILMRSAYYLYDSKWLAFIVFVMLGPLNLVAVVGFWGMTGKLFTLRQGKRLFGMIDSGQIFGMILSSFAVRYFLLKLVNNVTVNLLFISAISIAIALIIQILITRKFNINTDNIKKEDDEKKFISLFKSRYIALMSLFIILSMIVAFFILYSFMSVTQSRYPDPIEKANFISLVGAVAMIFSFLFKTFVYSKFINTYGLKAGLLLMPIVLGLFALISIVAGNLMGYSVESSSFMIFFLIIVLSRLMSISLKSSIEVPTFKVLYQSLDIKIRPRIQAGIDGVINEFAAIFAGIILFALGLLSFFEIIHYSYFLAFIIIIWVYVTFRLHKEYKKALVNTLRHAQLKESEKHEMQQSSLPEELRNNDVYLRFLRLTNFLEYEKHIVDKIETGEIIISQVDDIQNIELIQAEKKVESLIEQNQDPKITQKAKEILNEIKKAKTESLDPKLINRLLISIDEKERAKAAKLIGISKDQSYLNNIAILLRDIVPNVKISAIRAAAKLKNKELCMVLIELLEDHRYYSYAYDALNSIGKPALDSLEQGFHKTGQKTQVLTRIVNLMGIIGGSKAESYLLNKITMQNKEVIYTSLAALQKLGYTASSQEASRLMASVLKHAISITAWNLNIKTYLNKNEVGQLLYEALDDEIKENYELIFLILSLMYDPNSIDHIKSNINRGSSESISFAVELLELFLDEEIKPLLFPLLEDLSDNEKVRRLQNHFSLNKYNSETVLNAILNRDGNSISKWVKVCAFDSYNYLEDFQPNDAIKAHIFNRDRILKESAAMLTYRLNRKSFEECANRLAFKRERDLKNFVYAGKDNTYVLLPEKILYLKKLDIFKGLTNDMLCEIALYLNVIFIEKDEILFPKMKTQILPLYFIIEGSLAFEENKNIVYTYHSHQAITDNFLTSNKKLILKATDTSIVYGLEFKDLSSLLSKNSLLKNIIINNII